jgi:DNA polymerase III delta prime subunit
MAFIADLQKDFKRLLTHHRLGQSYLIFGEASLAAARFVREFARFLEGKEGAASHEPLLDALWCDGATTGIEEVRDLRRRLEEAPLRAPRRMLAIFGADRLTLPAQHAILKLAEEPPQDVLLMFTVRNPEVLIAPLASRFQKIYLSDKEVFLESADNDVARAARNLLAAKDAKARNEIFKKLLEEEADLFLVAAHLLAELKADPLRNIVLLKSLLARLALMNQFNVNKKLQLEAAFGVATSK